MEISRIQSDLVSQVIDLEVSSHAFVEAQKDGLTADDLIQVAHSGQTVEIYPERNRALLLGFSAEEGLPCHIVLEYFEEDEFATVVTAYIPEDASWHRDYKTRK